MTKTTEEKKLSLMLDTLEKQIDSLEDAVYSKTKESEQKEAFFHKTLHEISGRLETILSRAKKDM